MLEAVVECLVKKKMTTKDYAARAGIIVLDVVLAVIVFVIITKLVAFAMLGFLFGALGVFLTGLVFRNTDLEYEYQYFDGELSIDKIMAQRARKRLQTFKIGKMEYMAPLGSSHIRISQTEHKIFDYSTHNPDEKPYVVVVYDEKEKLVELRFSPNEELLNRLIKAYPRKVYTD